MTWIVKKNMQGALTSEKYLMSFYFTTATMMAVGYGDISAYTSAERWVAMLIQILGASMFGFIMAAIANFLDTHNPRASEIKKRLNDAQEWIYGRDCPRSIRQKVRDHFQYYYTRKSLFDNSEYLSDCAQRLRLQLVSTLNVEKIVQFSLFHSRSEKMVCALVTEMMPIWVGYKEEFLHARDVVRDLYLVQTGRVNGFDPETGLIHAIYRRGDHFCDHNLFCSENIDYEAALTYEGRMPSNDLHVIPQQVLKEVLADNPEDAVKLGECADYHAKMIDTSLKSESEKESTTLPEDISRPSHEGRRRYANLVVEAVTRPEGVLPVDYANQAAQYECVEMKNETTDELVEKHDAQSPPRETVSLASTEQKGRRRGWSELTLIDPQRPWKLAWDVWLGACIVYSVMVIPVNIGFNIEQRFPSETRRIMDLVVDIMFAVDMLFTFRTAYPAAPI
jgi:hypothetical protein